MAAAKYKVYVQQMLDKNKRLFESFRKIHDRYEANPDRWQEQFNIVGEEVQKVARDWENRLCGHSENGMYANFSSKLADKFRDEVRLVFPKIDNIGVIAGKKSNFSIKRIDLS